MSTALVHQLIDIGHDHEAAHSLAMRIPPGAHGEVARLTARASSGEATLVDLADAIQAKQGCGRESALADAERILHPRGQRTMARALSAEPTRNEVGPDPVAETLRAVRNGKATIVHLADKLETERRLGRDAAFAEAERMIRAR